ncbi:MAG: galactitol-1-phosphate 5-dehydrogenase [Clostridia bacterium]|nr:galactitol-1-phosphate 5-dehydrogenase [Clostridia bacterium]
MKAAILYGNADIRWSDHETPPVRPGTVKVRVRAAGICGSDVPRVLNHGAHFYPIVLGHEFSGDVIELGTGVTELSVGDAVSGVPLLPCLSCADCRKGDYALCKNYGFIGSRQQGAFAEYIVIPAHNAIRYHPSIPYEQAALFEPSAVALHGVRLNAFRGGETVCVLGCGTIGIFTIQWAALFGAKRIVALDIDPGRLAFAREMGADETLLASDPDCLDHALGLTGGTGYTSIFETAGNTETMRAAFALAGNRAHVCFIGTPRAALTFTPKEWEYMNRKEFRLTGSWMSYSAPFPGEEWDLTAHFFQTGQLRFDKRFIYKTYPFSQAREAFKLFQNPSGVHGKIMLLA